MDELEQEYASIQEEIDKYRVDEWHSLVPLMEDTDWLLGRLMEVSHPNIEKGANGLFLYQEEQTHIGWTKPEDNHLTGIFVLIMEDLDYIYQALVCDHYDPLHGCRVSQLTRLDKKRKG